MVHEGVMHTDQARKVQAMHDFFDGLMWQKVQRGHDINFQAIRIQEAKLGGLDSQISVEEVKAAITEIDWNKKPGPDGYTGIFYNCCWEIIKMGLMDALSVVQGWNARSLHLLNDATMVLLKKEDAESQRDYRPI